MCTWLWLCSLFNCFGLHCSRSIQCFNRDTGNERRMKTTFDTTRWTENSISLWNNVNILVACVYIFRYRCATFAAVRYLILIEHKENYAMAHEKGLHFHLIPFCLYLVCRFVGHSQSFHKEEIIKPLYAMYSRYSIRYLPVLKARWKEWIFLIPLLPTTTTKKVNVFVR